MKSSFDASDFAQALRSVEDELRTRLATAATTIARRARQETIKTLSDELHLRPKEVSGPAAAELRRANPSNLTATWTPGKMTQNVAFTGSVKWSRGAPLTFSSPSHGADATRTSAHGFMIGAKAWRRYASAAGKAGRFAGLRQIKTIKPNTLIGQDGTRSRERFIQTAELITPAVVAGAVETAFSRLGFQTSQTGETPTND